MKKNILLLFLLTFLSFYSCGIYVSPPGGVETRSIIGENTDTGRDFEKLPIPKDKIVVGVYKFRDQTGQYKASETNVDWSTAVPQGLTSILTKSLEDSNWFVPVERENIGNLLNERQIIRTTRQEYSNGNAPEQLPPLLFAGTLFEGGVISYDTNILTGGAGARYFGVGGSTKYRQDRITVYLRAVSTSSGKVLKTVYTSKTILSQSINASMFRYVDPDRLMEAEIGVTNNEPIQMAVTEAINKAVYLMVLEGIQNNLWESVEEDNETVANLLQEYEQEVVESNKRVAGRGIYEINRRAKTTVGLTATMTNLKGDFKTKTVKPGATANFGFSFNNYLGTNLSAGYHKMGHQDIYESNYYTAEANLEYMVLPYNKFSPYLFGGPGLLKNTDGDFGRIKFKTQLGAGLDYMVTPKMGIRSFVGYHIGFDDDWEGIKSGKRNDHYLQIGLGLQINLGKTGE